MASDWDLASLARAAGAAAGLPTTRIEAVATDSRKLPAGALFVALRGEKFDGHTFVPQAVRAGARAVLVDQRGAAKLRRLSVPVLVVPDTLRALGDMAAWVRKAINKPVAAVTGSNGKTTTKELLAAVLGQKDAVHKTYGNLNNLVGVPLTLYAWPEKAWAAVVEMGMNAPGEIARLTQIAQPNVGLVTCVAAAHLGAPGLGSLEAIAAAKAELFAELPADATAVLNQDDARLVHAAQPLLGTRRVIRFGHSVDCDVRVLDSTAAAAHVDLTLEVMGKPMRTQLPLLGRHNAMNAAAACAAAAVLGLTVEHMAEGLARAQVPGGRLRMLTSAQHRVTILDDTYNANPGSMAAALAAQGDVAGSARRLAVLGDMLELGDEAAALHWRLGEQIASAGVDMLWALGDHASQTAQGARTGGVTASHYQEKDIQVLCRDLSAQIRPGDVVLVKGSRSMRMERVVRWLQGEVS